VIAERFGANLARCRRAADLSQDDLGFRAGLHRTEISKLERGLRLPRIDTIIKLAGALQIEPGALLDGMAWQPGESRPGRFELPDSDATL
jgi:transcriptional regulator with XRE-family HTH domain